MCVNTGRPLTNQQLECIMAKTDLTAQRLRELLNYDPETGVFTNRAPRKKIRVGEAAGTLDKSTGYIVLCIDRRHYYGHRLAFLYVTGRWPVQLVDHKDGARTNNRWGNLRDEPRSINQQNMRHAMPGTASGLLGAFKKRARWESRIRIGEKIIRLGTFATARAAHEAYIVAKREHHPGCTI